jgi:predicted secreted Zn-dependent protease
MSGIPVARWLAALFAVMVIGAIPAWPEPVVKETIVYYDVTGADAREVKDNLDRLGPASPTTGKRHHATVRWYVSWNYRYKRDDTSCAIGSVSTTADVTITFPRLKTDSTTPAALIQSFNYYADRLMLHERGHAQNAIDTARRIETAIGAMPPERTCPILEQAANRLGHSFIKEANQWDIDYDARTQHGLTQGVRFPDGR